MVLGFMSITQAAIAYLKEQYAVGTVTAKIVQPRPNLDYF
jgi:hypothetical protein